MAHIGRCGGGLGFDVFMLYGEVLLVGGVLLCVVRFSIWRGAISSNDSQTVRPLVLGVLTGQTYCTCQLSTTTTSLTAPTEH